MRFVLRSIGSIILLHAFALCGRAQEPAAMKIAAPELQGIEAWINTKPFALKDLRGKVVVLHFWTFG
jgi:hypothetical protein